MKPWRIVQVLSEDLDLDGQQDCIRVEVGIVNMERVTSVALLLEFEYKLKVCNLASPGGSQT